MVDFCFKQLCSIIIFFIILSIEKCLALTICPTAVWERNATIVAGSSTGVGGSNSSGLYSPTDIDVDGNNTIYVLDAGNLRVQRFLSNSTVGTTVINGSYGSMLNQFSAMDAMTLDLSGNIYILDRKLARVTQWVPGAIRGIIVAGGNGNGSNTSQLNEPHGMFIDLNTLVIWIADTNNNRIIRWDSPSTAVVVCGSYGTEANQFYYPRGLFVDTTASNTLYVADTGNQRIQMWLPKATSGITVAGQTGVSGSGLDQLSLPAALLVDTNGYLYITDSGNNRIMRWAIRATSGTIIAGDSTLGNLPNQLTNPYNIRFDPSGALLVADCSNNRIEKFSVSCVNTTATTSIIGVPSDISSTIALNLSSRATLPPASPMVSKSSTVSNLSATSIPTATLTRASTMVSKSSTISNLSATSIPTLTPAPASPMISNSSATATSTATPAPISSMISNASATATPTPTPAPASPMISNSSATATPTPTPAPASPMISNSSATATPTPTPAPASPIISNSSATATPIATPAPISSMISNASKISNPSATSIPAATLTPASTMVSKSSTISNSSATSKATVISSSSMVTNSSTIATSTEVLLTTTQGSFASVNYYPKWSMMIFCSIIILINN